MKIMKYCKDCKYCFENLENIEYVCTHDDLRFISVSRRTEACEHFEEKLQSSALKVDIDNWMKERIDTLNNAHEATENSKLNFK